MIFPSSSGNPGGSSSCRTPYRKQVRRRRGCRAEAGRPALQRVAALGRTPQSSSEGPGRAVTLFRRRRPAGTARAGDLSREDALAPSGRAGRDAEEGEGAAARREQERAGGFAQLCNKFGFFSGNLCVWKSTIISLKIGIQQSSLGTTKNLPDSYETRKT